MSEIDKIFDIFFFGGQFRAIFQSKFANIFLKAYWIMSLGFVERLPTF